MKQLIKEEDILQKVKAIGKQINVDYDQKNPIVVGVLKGAFVFLADLLREIEIPIEVDFLSISSYNGKESSGVVRITHDLSLNIKDRDVILVEDIHIVGCLDIARGNDRGSVLFDAKRAAVGGLAPDHHLFEV